VSTRWTRWPKLCTSAEMRGTLGRTTCVFSHFRIFAGQVTLPLERGLAGKGSSNSNNKPTANPRYPSKTSNIAQTRWQAWLGNIPARRFNLEERSLNVRASHSSNPRYYESCFLQSPLCSWGKGRHQAVRGLRTQIGPTRLRLSSTHITLPQVADRRDPTLSRAHEGRIPPAHQTMPTFGHRSISVAGYRSINRKGVAPYYERTKK
jgi:hypothetical protein